MRKITLFFVLLSFTVFSFAQSGALKNFNNSKELFSLGVKKPHNNTNTSNPKTAFSESFEGTFPPAGWSRIMPDTGSGWRVDTVGSALNGWTGTSTITAPTGGGNQVACITWIDGGSHYNDSWLVTPQLTISSGDVLSFWVSNSPSYLDSIDVLVSTTTNARASFNTTILRKALPGGAAWTKYTLNLTSYYGQQIYIAFREHVSDNSNDGGYVCLDLVSIAALPATDAGVLSVTSPVMSCSMSAAEHVIINVKNFGASAISNIPVHYKFNNGTTVDGTVAGPLASGATVLFTFPATIDASAFQVDSIIAWTSITGDGDATNDYAPMHYFANVQPSSVPFNQGFETPNDLMGYLIVDSNGDGSSWNIAAVDSMAHSGSNFLYYQYNSTHAADDWAFTKCINLNAGAYTLSFWYRAKGFPEKLEVKMGTVQTAAGMTQMVVSLPSINGFTYTRSSSSVTITTTGTYYIGLHAISDADEFLLIVDDLSLSAGAGIEEKGKAVINIFPNPVNDVLFIESTDNIEEICIFNALGQTIYNSNVNDINFTINTSDLNEGIYFIKLKTADGYTTRKVLVN